MTCKYFCLPSIFVASTLIVVAPAGANESAYTDAVTKSCKTLVEPAPDEPGGDFIVLECKGYKNWAFTYKEGDLRASVHYGYLSNDALDNQFESFAQFNSVGKKVEWRLDENKIPVAAIIRYFVEYPDPETGSVDNGAKGQVLVISKVGVTEQEDGCVIGYVDALANTDANKLARELADENAASFQCGTDQAAFFGKKGPRAGDPTSSLQVAQ